MSVYGTNSPLSQYAIDPQFATDSKTKAKLGLLGYDQTGQQNAWGKISSWIPGLNLGLNKIAENVAENNGATDTMGNVGEDFDNRLNKNAIVGGAAMAVGGAVTGNPALAMKGLGMATQFGGALAFDQNNLVTEGQYIYR